MCNYALACCNNNRFKLDGVAADAVVPGTSVNSCGIRQWNNSLELMRAVMSLRARRRPRTLIGHCSVFTSGHRYATQCRYILYYQLTIAQTSREASTSRLFLRARVQLGRSAADEEKHPKIQRRRLQSIIILSRVYVNLLAANSASKQEALKQYREHVTPQSCCRQISGVICALTRGSAAVDALISNGEKRSAAYLVRPRRARRKAHAERARPRDTATATATATHPPAQRIRP